MFILNFITFNFNILSSCFFYQLFNGHCSAIRHVQFAMDSAKLFSFGEDTVIIWDFLPTKQKLLSYTDESKDQEKDINYETIVTCKFLIIYIL